MLSSGDAPQLSPRKIFIEHFIEQTMKQKEKSYTEWFYALWLIVGLVLGFLLADKFYSQSLLKAQNTVLKAQDDTADVWQSLNETLDTCEKAVCTLNKDTIELTQVANACLTKLQQLTGQYYEQLNVPKDVCNKLG